MKRTREEKRAECIRLGFSWEHWRCRRCHGHGKVEVHGTGKYDSDNDWVKCPEVIPESEWGFVESDESVLEDPSLLTVTIWPMTYD